MNIPPIAYIAIACVAVGGAGYFGTKAATSSTTVIGQDRGHNLVSGKEQVKAALETLSPDLKTRYGKLKDLLQGRHWEEADVETTERLLEAAGPEAFKRGFVEAQEMASLSMPDLQAVDTLWSAASHGRFGFAKQAYIYKNYAKGDWKRLYKLTAWQDLDGGPAISWDYDKIKGRYVVTRGLDPKFQQEGQYPTFNRGYNTTVSLDSRLVQVKF